jgi:uncharacterized OsmC-like protein
VQGVRRRSRLHNREAICYTSRVSLAEAFDATITAVRTDPARAAVRLQVSGTALDGVATTVQAGRHSLTVDEPPSLGGQGQAPNPVQIALAALASCQVVTYRYWATRLGVRVDSLTIDAEGDLDQRGLLGLDDDVRPGFTAVRVTVRVTGPEPQVRYAELREAVDVHCPVLDLFVNATPVSTRLEAEGTA